MKERVKALIEEGVADINNRLYEESRHAIAHGENPGGVITIDDFQAEQRIVLDLVLVAYLAQRAIEAKGGVPTIWSVMDAHEYHLSGFRSKLGEAMCAELDGGKSFPSPKIELPNIVSVRLRREPSFAAMENLRVQVRTCFNGVVELRVRSAHESVQLTLRLDFPNNRMAYDPFETKQTDFGTSASATELAEYSDFARRHFGNGYLEVWSEADNLCLGRLDCYIPVNMMATGGVDENPERKRWREVAAERKRSEDETQELK